MDSRSALLCSLALVTIACCDAWCDDLYGPTMGLVSDSHGSALRAIRGMPGAATIGEALDLGADAGAIAVAPRQSRAVVITATGARLVVVQPDGTVADADTGIAASVASPAVTFSPSGSVAGLYDAGANTVWLWHDQAVRVDTTGLPDTIDLFAISDRPAPLVAGTLRTDRHSVFVLDGKGAHKVLSGFNDVADLTFLGSGGNLAVCDRGAKQVFVVRDPLANGAPDMVLDLSASSQAPFRISSSLDGSLLAVLASGEAANGSKRNPTEAGRPSMRRSNSVGLLRLADRQWTPIDCHCAATALAPLTGNAVFRLTDRIDQPLWILDAEAGTPRVVFIPAVRP